MTWRSVVVGVPPLLLAAVGLVHPMVLSPGTSQHWTVLHLALVTVFPLRGVCLWLRLRREQGVLAIAGG